jgi:nicotinamidase-related amidase
MPAARNQVTSVLVATRAAIGRARRDGALIVKVGNEFRPRDWAGNLLRRHAAVAGSTGTRWDARADVPGAPYLPKWKPDAFCNPRLQQLLASHGIEQVVLAGLYARACVSATAKGALARSLRVTVQQDAVACRSDSSRQAALERLARTGAEVTAGGTATAPPAAG